MRDTWVQLYRFAYSWVQNREEAEDVAQEAYSRILSRSRTDREVWSRDYLFATARNLIRDRWRRRQVHGTPLSLDETTWVPGATKDDPDQAAWVRDLMAGLPEDYRRVLELRIVQGYSRAEVAERMGRTEAAVRNLQYRALQTLRELMADDLKEGT